MFAHKRVLSMLLSVAMVLSMLPAGVLAADTPCPNHPQHTESCGYHEADGAPCGHSCESCAPTEAAPAVDEAVEAVRAMVDALPAVEAVQQLPLEEQHRIYLQTQTAYEAWQALTDDQKALLPQAQTVFASLFDYFNTLTAAAVDFPSGSTGAGTGGSFDAFEGSWGNLSWTLEEGVLTITGSGSMPAPANDSASPTGFNLPWAHEVDAITTIVIGEGIHNVSNSAFNNHKKVTSVTLPNSLTVIENYGFNGCESLQSVNLPAGLNSMGWSAFSGCKALTAIVIPAGITKILEYTFYNCASLSQVTIPESVTVIGNSAFAGCKALQSITLPSGLTAINGGCFASAGLTSVTIPESVAVIKNNAFSSSALTSVTIPAGVRAVEEGAFGWCENLECVTFAGSAPVIGENAFSQVNATVRYPANYHSWNADVRGSYGGTLIWESYDNGSSEAAPAPDAVLGTGTTGTVTWTVTGDGTLTLSGSGTTGSYGYDGTTLTSYSQPWAAYAGQITRVVVEAGVTGLGSFCFANMDILTSVLLPEGLKTLDAYVFTNCGGLTEIALPSTLTVMQNSVFSGCPALKSVEIPEGITSLESLTFSYCTALESVSLPRSLTHISMEAFANCRALAEITLPENLRSMESSVFSGCTALRTVTFLGGAPSIGQNAFRNVTATVIYPDGDTWPEASRDSYGGTLTWEAADGSTPDIPTDPTDPTDPTVPSEPPQSETVGGTFGAMTWTLEDGVLTVTGSGEMPGFDYATPPAGMDGEPLSAFFATPWAEYNDCVTEVVLGDGITSIAAGAFANMPNLEKVTIPATVTAIGDHAFKRCGALAEVTLPAGLTALGEGAFFLCVSLTQIAVPSGVTEIKAWTFMGCANLAEVTLPGEITAIGHGAFSQCGFSSINLGSALKRVGSSAFELTNLAEIAFPDTLTAIESGAFFGCGGLTQITFRGSAPALAEDAFSGVTATAYYPRHASWTEDVRLGYGGSITWHCADGETVASGTDGNITWVLDDSGRLVISGTGKMPDYKADYGPNPTYLYTYPWVPYASRITSVEVQEGITHIGDYAFYRLVNLSSVQLPQSLQSIGYAAFGEDESLVSIHIPDSVFLIGKFAFGYCENLVSVHLPARLRAIPDSIFTWCGKLRSVTIPAPVSSIGSIAFNYCYDLEEICFLGSAPNIDRSSFSGVTATVQYPANYPSWTAEKRQDYGGDLTWQGYTAETEEPDSYPENILAQGSFSGFTWQVGDGGTLTVSGTGAMPAFSYDSDSPTSYNHPWREYLHLIGRIVIAEGVTTVSSNAFAAHNQVIAVELPNTLKRIDSMAFDCESLTALEIPDSVTEVRSNAVSAWNLKSLKLPAGLKVLEEMAFNCNKLSSVTIPAGVEVIENYAFGYVNHGLATITFEGTAPLIEPAAFNVVTATVRYPANYYSWSEDMRINYGGSLTWVSYDNGKSEPAPDPDSVLASGTLGGLTWKITGNEMLTISGTGSMPDFKSDSASRTGYDQPWASWMAKIKGVTVESGVTSLGAYAFAGLTKLKKVNLAASVTTLGTGAFRDSGITSIAIPAGVKVVEDKLFQNCAGLSSVTIPEGVTAIGDSAFSGCAALTAIVLPQSLTVIGANAFDSCGLTSLTIPNGVTRMGRAALVNTPLRSLTLSNSLQAIPAEMLFGCFWLESLEIPESVMAIGSEAFAYCSEYLELTFLGSAPAMASNAFAWASPKGYYPRNYASWSQDVLDSQKNVTWVSYDNGKTEPAPGPDDILASGSFGGFAWSLSGSGTLTVSGTGDMPAFKQDSLSITGYDQPWALYSGKVRSVVVGEGITSVSGRAFYGCGMMTAVTLGSTVSRIDNYAFYGCKAMRTISLPAEVSGVGSYAFANCTALTEVVLPDGVSTLGSYAFCNCTGLTKVTLPQGLSRLESYVFSDCTALQSITIPDSVTAIGYRAFDGCAALSQVQLPASLATIGSYAFCGTALRELTLPQGVRYVDSNAFQSCKALTGVTLPANIQIVSSNAFDGCTALTRIFFEGSAPEIGQNAFRGVTAEANYPAGVSGWTASVRGSYGGTLTWVSYTKPIVEEPLPENLLAHGHAGVLSWALTTDGILTVFGSGAMPDFDYDSSSDTGYDQPWAPYFADIKVLVVEEGVTSLGDYALAGCFQLRAAQLSAGITRLGRGVFSGCSSLETVKLPHSITAIGPEAFSGCSKLQSVTVPQGVKVIENGTFSYCTALTRVELPQNLTVIGERAFEDCEKLTALAIPGGVTQIGKNAFRSCTALTQVTLPQGLTRMESGVFSSCGGLASITIPASVTVVGSDAFGWCRSLREITFSGSAPAIYNSAFADVTATVHYPSNFPSWTPELRSGYGGTLTWRGYNNGATEPAPAPGLTLASGETGNLTWVLGADGVLTISGSGAMPDYMWDSDSPTGYSQPWAAYCDRIRAVEIADGVTAVGMGAFAGCFMLQRAALPDSLTRIGAEAFYNCGILTAVSLPDGLSALGSSAFSGCRSLTSVTVPEGITVLEYNTFAYCESLTQVILPQSLTKIGSHVFAECWELAAVNIPAGVQSIGTGAFRYCQSLTAVTVPEGITSIEDQTFYGCDGLTSVTIPASVEMVGREAFAWSDNLREITFCGSAPAIYPDAFDWVTATARYPMNHPSWDDAARQNYGGTLTWEAYDSGTTETLPDPGTVLASGMTGDLRWSLTVDGLLTITGAGAMPDFEYDFDDLSPTGYDQPWAQHFASIRSVAVGSGVTSVGEHAFTGCFRLQSVSLPAGLTRVGDYAFRDCQSLTAANLPAGLTELGDYAFSGCSSLKAVTVPEGITRLEEGTFAYCTSLAQVSLPQSLRTVGSYAFDGCNKLTVLAIPSGVTAIGQRAFSHCGITSLRLPQGITRLEDGIFEDCFALKSITVPASVELVGNNAFGWCESLTEVTFTGSAPAIYPSAFSSITATVRYPMNYPSWDADTRQNYGGTLTWKSYDSGSTEPQRIASGSCGDGATWALTSDGMLTVTGTGDMHAYPAEQIPWAAYRDSITGVTVNPGITSLTGNAFAGCTALEQVNLPDSLGLIGQGAFAGCTALTQITLPAGVDEIPEEAFRDCTGLSMIYIPETVTSIASGAFRGCTGVQLVRFAGDPPAIADDAFLGVTARAQTEVSNPNWTEDAKGSYGGAFTWETYTENRLSLTGLVDEGVTQVWINGSPMTVSVENGQPYVDLPTDSYTVMTVYTMHQGDPEDIHTHYPTHMQVWLLSSENGTYSARRVEELDDILQYSGSSIRITGNKGIRMITSVDTEKKGALTSGGLAGLELVEYGTILCWKTDLEGGNPMTLGQSYSRSNYAYRRGVADPVFNRTDTLTQYTNVLVGFTTEQCADDIAMRPYIILEDDAGRQYTVYGGIVYRSIGYIAWQNRTVFAPGTASYDYVWNIIHYVYGDQWDADYQG